MSKEFQFGLKEVHKEKREDNSALRRPQNWESTWEFSPYSSTQQANSLRKIDFLQFKKSSFRLLCFGLVFLAAKMKYLF